SCSSTPRSNSTQFSVTVLGSSEWDSAVLSTARVGFSQCSKHRHYRIALEFGVMRARIAYERLNELQRRRLLRRTSAHNPVPILIGEHREVLHRLHISPTGQRLPRAWDGDVPPGALSAAPEALTIACQLARVFDCGRRAPCNRPRSQPALWTGGADFSLAKPANVLARGARRRPGSAGSVPRRYGRKP